VHVFSPQIRVNKNEAYACAIIKDYQGPRQHGGAAPSMRVPIMTSMLISVAHAGMPPLSILRSWAWTKK